MKKPPSTRSTFLVVSAIVTGSLTLSATRASAEETPPPVPATPAPATPAPKRPLKINYKVPGGVVGTPGSRENGGTRGASEALPSLYVLAPGHLALTTKAQPVLFWYQSAPAKVALEISLVEPSKPKPVLAVQLDKAEKAGIRAISLAQHNVTLNPGVEYTWSVSLIPDAASRSKDKFASAAIKRITPPEGLVEKTGNLSKAELASAYAEAGLWYDALQAISEAISANPKDPALHKMRASLLEQGKLPEVAKAEPK